MLEGDRHAERRIKKSGHTPRACVVSAGKREKMEFRLTIDMDNDAFDDSQELPRLLRKLAKEITEQPEAGIYGVMDSNGNSCGSGRYVGVKAKQ